MRNLFQPMFLEKDTLEDVAAVMATAKETPDGGLEAYPRKGLKLNIPNLPKVVRAATQSELRRRVREELDASTRRAWS